MADSGRAGARVDPDVIAPNFKRRLSGVTATIARLVPLQARRIHIVATGPGLPPHVPHLPLWRVLLLPRRRDGRRRWRVWHARRNTEMVGGLLLRHLARLPLRLVFTSASQRRHKPFTRWLIRRMDAVIATSRATAGYLERPEAAEVILHGIDTASFRPAADRAALRRRLGLPEDARIVGCFGRIRAQKGTDVFLEAMLEVMATRPDVHALILGRATAEHRAFREQLHARARAAGLAARVHDRGEVPVDRIHEWYAALDLFVAPQRWEGFGLTPLEAMACAVPVVATTVGAFPELVVDGVTGSLVPPGEAGAMAAAIARWLDDAEARRAAAQAARRHVEAHFRIEDEAEAINRVYRRLLAAP